MNLSLSEADRAMLDGERGPATRLAISILARMAEVYRAERLLDISAAHIDSTIYIGEAGLEFAERLATLGGKVAVPATANVTGLDELHWQEWPVPADWARNAQRQMEAYRHMGCVPTWTCAPYQTAMKPTFGQQIAWGESNAIAFANSVIGARTERYPDLLDICCAITGRVPAVGLHLTENRAGQMLVNLADVPADLQQDDSFYPVLGHLLGKLAGDRIPVVNGLSVTPTEDQFKALCAAGASSGAIALLHVVGVTPEAPTLSAAFQGREPEAVYDVGMAQLRAARRELTTAEGAQLDMVVLGSPHFSLAEFRQLAPLLAGKRKHPAVEFLVTSSRAMTQLAARAGYLETLTAFGGRITVDTCILATPMLPPTIRRLMTNSAKYAYYAPGLLNTEVAFGSMADCVRSAVAGTVMRDDSLWGDGAVSVPFRPAYRKDEAAAHATVGQTALGRPAWAGEPLIAGEAQGETLAGNEPLSFWGGYDHTTGEITDRRHPLSGQNGAGRILAVPFTRGSSTTTAVLLEAIRAGTAPAAILTTARDPFFALASIVADELYSRPLPIVVLPPEAFAALRSGEQMTVNAQGIVKRANA
jgi:predicted aconitase/predicted aconitase with swiveling domain